MISERRGKEFLVILSIVSFLMLNYPLLSIFDRLLLLWGIPLLYFYIFLVWLLIIIAMAIIVERRTTRNNGSKH